jgi:hypothetical protein
MIYLAVLYVEPLYESIVWLGTVVVQPDAQICKPEPVAPV